MPMDLLEHEAFTAGSSIATRASQVLTTIGAGGSHELPKSFLIKRMEIEYVCTPDVITDDAALGALVPMMLALHKNSVAATVDTVAEQLDARIDDIMAHQQIIWRRKFIFNPSLIDDGDNITQLNPGVAFKTSKSFSKGFRLDKDELYRWVIFNPLSGSSNLVAFHWLTVRYWGVYIE